MDETRSLLRRLLATIAYRTAKCLRDAPGGFADFAAGNGARTPAEIVRHLLGGIHFAGGLLVGAPRVEEPPLPWEDEVARLEAALRQLDERIAAAGSWHQEPAAALQGPLTDALTHVGQLAMLRRLAGSPIPAENFSRADIAPGRLALR